MNTSRAQFQRLSNPTAAMSVMSDSRKNAPINCRKWPNMNSAAGGKSPRAFAAFIASCIWPMDTIMLIIMYWAIAIRVERTPRPMKTHASRVTKSDRPARVGLSALLIESLR